MDPHPRKFGCLVWLRRLDSDRWLMLLFWLILLVKWRQQAMRGKKGRKMQCFKPFKSMLSFECVQTLRVHECICKHSHWKYKEYLGVRETHNNRQKNWVGPTVDFSSWIVNVMVVLQKGSDHHIICSWVLKCQPCSIWDTITWNSQMQCTHVWVMHAYTNVIYVAVF